MEASGPAHDLVVNESEDGGDDVSQLTALEQYGAYDFAKDDVYLVRSAPYGLFTGQTALGPLNSVLCVGLNNVCSKGSQASLREALYATRPTTSARRSCDGHACSTSTSKSENSDTLISVHPLPLTRPPESQNKTSPSTTLVPTNSSTE